MRVLSTSSHEQSKTEHVEMKKKKKQHTTRSTQDDVCREGRERGKFASEREKNIESFYVAHSCSRIAEFDII
jgi:hypothetical protein